MIAAIGSDGRRPVVWGIGETAAEARTDAFETEETWSSDGHAYVDIPERVAARVIEGSIDCVALGIAVTVRDGRIVGADFVGAELPRAVRP